MAFGDKTYGFESLKMNLKLVREEKINKRRERKSKNSKIFLSIYM